MAANLDKAESSLTTVSDLAYIRGVDASGNSVKISKSDLASVLGVKSKSDSIATTEGAKVLETGRISGIMYLMDMPTGNGFMAIITHSSVKVVYDMDSLSSLYNIQRTAAGGDITISLPSGTSDMRGFKYIFLYFPY